MKDISSVYLKKSASKHLENLLNKISAKKHIQFNYEEKFIEMVEDFWKNPKQNFNKLKNKYKVPPDISVYDIIKSYPTHEYESFYLDCLNENIPFEEILIKYNVSEHKIDEMMFPIYMTIDDRYCPHCVFTNEYEVNGIVKDIKNGLSLEKRCINCNYLAEPNGKYFTKDEVTEYKNLLQKQRAKTKEKITGEDAVKCYKCQNEYKIVDTASGFKLQCKKCGITVSSISEAEERYKKWKQHAAMMITLKAREKELLEKTIKSKRIEDVLFKKEDIIKYEDNNFSLGTFTYGRDEFEAWTEIYRIIKSLSKAGLHVLVTIIDLVKKGENNEHIWGNDTSQFKVLRFTHDIEPVVIKLYNETGLIMLRTELKRIMEKGLIIVNEETNTIDVLSIIVKNQELIRKFLSTQKFNNAQLRHMIFSNNNFTCVRCGETGRPLKIAYCTTDKRINDLNLLLPICDQCFEIATENEILIDGTFTSYDDVEDEFYMKAWDFATLYCSILKDDEEIKNEIRGYYSMYEENEIIKALAITLDSMDRYEDRRSRKFFLNYTRKLLLNRCNVEEWLNKKYKLNEWLD